MNKKQFFLFLLIFFLFISLFTEETNKENKEKEEKSLFLSTLNEDLDTANYYELLSWCRVLGLSEKGSKSELRQILRDYYNLQIEQKPLPENGRRKITIKSAKKTEYFTIEEIDEEYISIVGNVVIEVVDDKKKSVHSINAEKILFNQKQNTIEASGNVVYTREVNNSRETFTGESLTFNVDNWDGVLFYGVSKKSRKINGIMKKGIVSGEQYLSSDKEGKNESYSGADSGYYMDFYYSGDTIYRSERDVITLTDGVISTTKEKDPTFRIKAKKIWILGSGEWGLKHATIYVGRVPVFYTPFFFKTSDKMFFNPCIGRRVMEGGFLQTTTYIVGEREEKNTGFSFMQGEDESGIKYKKELNGLFLQSTDEPLDGNSNNKNFLKILIDIYTRLGYYAAVDGDFSSTTKLEKLNFYFGLGFSKNIYISPGSGNYTNFWEKDGRFTRKWNSSYLFSSRIPFRYGLKTDVAHKNKYYSIDFGIESYSDVFFKRDFSNRAEEINWSEMISFSKDDNLEGTAGNVAEGSEIDRLIWSLSGTINPETEKTNPYLSTFSINPITISINWASKEYDINSSIPENYWSPFVYPERKFYYPESYLFPYIGLSLGGTIFSYSTGISNKKFDRRKAGNMARPPWEEDIETDKNIINDQKKNNFKIPDLRGDITILPPKEWKIFSHNLGYMISPKFSIDHKTNNSEWEKAEDIDFSTKYSVYNFNGSMSLNYSASIMETLFNFDNDVAMSGNHNKHFNRSDSFSWSEWMQERESGYKTTNLNLSNSMRTSINPFFNINRLSTSKLTYALNTTLFMRKYSHLYNESPVYSNHPFAWNEDFVNVHTLDFDLNFKLLKKIQTLHLGSVLPPRPPVCRGKLSMYTGPLTSTISAGARKINHDYWEPDPVVIDENFSFLSNSYLRERLEYNSKKRAWDSTQTDFYISALNNKISFKESFTYDILNREPEKSFSEIKLWTFFANFTAQQAYPWEFNVTTGWQEKKNDMEFLPYSFSTGINAEYESDPFWKNRIQFKTDFSTSLDMNLLKFTDSSMKINLGFSFKVYKFIDFKFSSTTENNSVYRYFSKYCDKVGKTRLNFFQDLAKSFAFFNPAKRRESNFNLKKLSISMIHHLENWDLVFEYSGEPRLETLGNGSKQYQWKPIFSIFLQWRPIPEIQKYIEVDNGTITF